MKKEQILNSNKLIAEFMGAKSIHNPTGYDIHDDKDWYKYNELNYESTDFKFHSSWDWLIPVLEKIEQLGYHTRICFDDFGSWMQIHYGLSVADTDETKALNQHGTKIENTFKSVVEFIKWYNKNGKPSRKK